MLSDVTRALVKGTAPVLQANGVALTSHFYDRLFRHNPELREVFNQGHQRSGAQQQALAMAVAAYAENIDDPSALLPVLERVAAKHMSLGVRQEHYAVVGRHLMASIAEVLGTAATPMLLEAWAQAYAELADLLAGMERALYDKAAAQVGGWTGWRTFRVQSKRVESDEVTSFELVPADAGPVPTYRPGQYVSVRLVVPALGYRQPRQYSLSDAPGLNHLRISVKREGGHGQPAGMVSHALHQDINEGDVIEVAPPTGDFFLHEDRQTPVVLISAGIGITPMMSMLAHIARKQPARPVHFLHAARHAGVQAFGQRVDELVRQCTAARAWIVHESAHPATPRRDALGRLSLPDLAASGWLPADADFYICGPVGFMAEQIRALHAHGVPAARVHAEAFGTGGISKGY